MKNKISYECQQCGSKTPKWTGKCNTCGAWNSLIEIVEDKKDSKLKSLSKRNIEIQTLRDIDSTEDFRITTDIAELDRVLGGGIIPGSFILVGGDPGIGKSTLMLQMCAKLKDSKPLYVTAEESLKQIKYRSNRIKGIDDSLMLMCDTNLENIDYAIKNSDCEIVIVDSIQSIYTEKLDATPGSISQVRECATLLMQTAKSTHKAIFIIGHVTKDGIIAGPKVLEHTVDTVLQFEGEKTYSFRILRALKNRFGSTNEIGIFEMCEEGLMEVSNPSEIFLAKRNRDDSGIAIVAAIEGTRPILLEMQALVTPSGYSVPQRTANGFDNRRLQMILAVLEKRLGMQFRQQDVFVNVAGGVYMNDTALDLAISAAIVSSFKDQPVDSKTVLIGEIGLTGEVRSVSNIDQRISEISKLGFERILIPKGNFDKLMKKYEVNLVPVERISLALSEIL